MSADEVLLRMRQASRGTVVSRPCRKAQQRPSSASKIQSNSRARECEIQGLFKENQALRKQLADAEALKKGSVWRQHQTLQYLDQLEDSMLDMSQKSESALRDVSGRYTELTRQCDAYKNEIDRLEGENHHLQVHLSEVIAENGSLTSLLSIQKTEFSLLESSQARSQETICSLEDQLMKTRESARTVEVKLLAEQSRVLDAQREIEDLRRQVTFWKEADFRQKTLEAELARTEQLMASTELELSREKKEHAATSAMVSDLRNELVREREANSIFYRQLQRTQDSNGSNRFSVEFHALYDQLRELQTSYQTERAANLRLQASLDAQKWRDPVSQTHTHYTMPRRSPSPTLPSWTSSTSSLSSSWRPSSVSPPPHWRSLSRASLSSSSDLRS